MFADKLLLDANSMQPQESGSNQSNHTEGFFFWGGGGNNWGVLTTDFTGVAISFYLKLVNDRQSRTVSKTCVQDSSKMANK